jgi:hypothetical protein
LSISTSGGCEALGGVNEDGMNDEPVSSTFKIPQKMQHSASELPLKNDFFNIKVFVIKTRITVNHGLCIEKDWGVL